MKPSGSAMNIMKALLCVALSASWMVERISASDGADMENKTNPADNHVVKFELVAGRQYPLCRDYVDMLNNTQYSKVPVCERKILPGFAKFKAIAWTEINDKAEIGRITREGIRLANINNTLWPHAEEEQWRYQKTRMDAGIYNRMYTANIDMDHDGDREVVYKIVATTKLPGQCTTQKGFLVIDAFNDPSNRLAKGYLGLWAAGVSALFYYDGRVYVDYWEGVNARYHLKVNEISGIPNQVCGINIVK